MFRSICPAAFLFVATIAAARPTRAATDSDFQVWNALTAQMRLAPETDWGLWFDGQVRRNQNGTLMIIRPGIGYHVTSAVVVHVGYVLVSNFNDDTPNTHEQRIWQQGVWTDDLSDNLRISARVRLEQRFGVGDEIGHRVRGMVRGQWKPVTDFPLFLVGWDEAFVQINDTKGSAEAGFDQNRLFLGVGAPVALRWTRVEVGYMHIFINRAAGDHSDHAIAINLFVTR